MRTVLIFNAKAGARRDASDRLRELASELGLEVRETEGSGDARRLAGEASADGVRRVIVAGGDGTVHEAVNGLAAVWQKGTRDEGGATRRGSGGRDPGEALRQAGAEASDGVERVPVELGIVPLGTGNDLARSLGLSASDWEDCLRLATHGEAVDGDLIRFRAMLKGEWLEERWAVNAAVGGLGSLVSQRVESDDKRRWGPLAYWKAAAAEVADAPHHRAEITVDGETLRAEVHAVAVANGRYAGGGMPLSDGSLDDGRLDVVALPVQGVLGGLAAGIEAALGEHSVGDHLITRRGKRVEIASEPVMAYSVDGEHVPCDRIRFEAVRGAVRLVVGDGAAVKTNGAA